jgi:hypothetical protein
MLSGCRPWGNEEAISATYKLSFRNVAPPIAEDVADEITPAALGFLFHCYSISWRLNSQLNLAMNSGKKSFSVETISSRRSLQLQ